MAKKPRAARQMDSHIDEDKYAQNQKRYWEQLHQEFNRLKSELGATNSELARCLGISRQSLVSFMQNSSSGLPIQRSHLERLWDLLTDPEQLEEKRVSSDAKVKREELRRKGPGALLKAAGFLPGSSGPVLDIGPERWRNQPIQRIVSRLSNLPIADSTTFIKLAEDIEDLISGAIPSDRRNPVNPEQRSYLGMRSEESIEQWIKNNALLHEPGSEIEEKFKSVVSRLAVSGKYELENSEMFELYMSILENERLYSEADESLKMRITQCQFKTLTFLLKDYTGNEAIEHELNQAGLAAERQLRSALCDTRYIHEHLENALSDVVIEVSIMCNLRKTNESLCWRYSSSTTHLENMLAAMSYGVGCESELELADLSIRSLGRRDYSLVKASSVFKSIHTQENYQYSGTYQSVWVDRSAILGILQSFVMAIRGWLAEKFTDPESYESYYNVCKAVAIIDENLTKGRKVLNGYRIQHGGYSGAFTANHYLEKEVIGKIQELQANLLRKKPLLRDLYGATLEHKYCVAKLSCAHSSLIEGDMKKATELLADVEQCLEKATHKNTPLNVLLFSEKTLQLFFLGDQDFISNKQLWRSDIDRSVQELSDYIYKTRRDCGRFDYDVYMIASEIFGRMGRLSFCLCGSDDGAQLEDAVQSFLQAAYCSSKIGHKQRAAHWMSNVSRICSRLGDSDRAISFADLAKNIIEQVIEPAYSLEYREALMAEINMSYGEQLLLIEKDFDGAIQYFLKALRGSIYIGFVRLIADSLYDISRASQYLGNYRVIKSVENAFGKEYDFVFREELQGWKENKLAVEVIKFVNQVDKNEVWSSVSEQFKQEAKKIWHRWANVERSNGERVHPIEEAIESGSYLSKVR
jgi:tetratricopeptide (TPR) repeat protein